MQFASCRSSISTHIFPVPTLSSAHVYMSTVYLILMVTSIVGGLEHF